VALETAMTRLPYHTAAVALLMQGVTKSRRWEAATNSSNGNHKGEASPRRLNLEKYDTKKLIDFKSRKGCVSVLLYWEEGDQVRPSPPARRYR
jgi:hypothetical protein